MVEDSAMAEPARTKTGVVRLATETQSLVDRVSHEVRRSIIEGRVRPGESLSISDLATDLGVSPSPVREALQRLAGQGLVLLRPARTAVIAPLEVGDLEEIYRLRQLIEVDAVVRALALLTQDDVREMEAELETARVAALDTTAFWEAHDAFHRVLLQPVLTPRLDQLITQLWQSAQRYIRLVYIETDALSERNAVERHVPLIDAARSADPERMRAVYTDHLETNEADIRQYLERMLAAG
jgi:DNA-binding GntR family transcriptional regulator